MIRLTVLNDNQPGPGLQNKWGWSIHIATRDARILFDADTEPDVLCNNADRLGIELEKTSYAILSHEHWDHYGGMPCVAKRRPGIRVYAPMGLHLWAKNLDINLTINRSGQWISDTIYLTRPLKSGLILEHALAVKVDSRYIIIVVGCSHPGVDNLVYEASNATGLKPLLVIGGYHGPSKEQLDNLLSIAEYVAPAHCSGERAVRYIESRSPEKLVMVRTGTELLVENGEVRVVKF